MVSLLEIVKWISAHWQEVLLSVQAILGGLIAICLLIPGDQPEKTLQKVVDILSKLSKK